MKNANKIIIIQIIQLIYIHLCIGEKYEPVSTIYYEWINNTKVDEFGCIPHNEYSFLGASPDGIVCDISSNLYGRMLEIKNVVSREITGIPKNGILDTNAAANGSM